ncbi:MAG: hypothetical protein WC712_10940 [Candidatus Brocadiia bacterium]
MTKIKMGSYNILITGLLTWALAIWLAKVLDSMVVSPRDFGPALVWALGFVGLPILIGRLLVWHDLSSLGCAGALLGLLFASLGFAHSCVAGNFYHAAAFLAFFAVPVLLRLLIDWALSPFFEFHELTAEDGPLGRFEQWIRRKWRQSGDAKSNAQ